MSCEDCELKQKDAFNSCIDVPVAYVRVGNGNVAIVGCNKHLSELILKLREVKPV